MFVIGSIFLSTVFSTDLPGNYFPDNLKIPQDWVCNWPTKSCYWVTDDVNRLNDGDIIDSSECRYDQPELTLFTSMLLNSYSSTLCGCQYCSFTIPTVSPTLGPTYSPTRTPTRKPTDEPTDRPSRTPTRPPTLEAEKITTNLATPEPTNEPILSTPEPITYWDYNVEDEEWQQYPKEPTPTPSKVPTVVPTEKPTSGPTYVPTPQPTRAVNWMTFEDEEFRNADMTSPMAWINLFSTKLGFSPSTSFFETGAGNYTLFFCIKSLETLATTCEPVVICTPSPSCLAKKKDINVSGAHVQSANKASGDVKSLWGLLFLPGFFVGICAAYGIYRHRANKNRLKETTKASMIGQQFDNQVSVPQNQPVLQNMQNVPNLHYVQQGHRANAPNYQQNQGVPMTNEGDATHHGESIAVKN